LRHKSLATTERYIQNINDDLKDTLDLISLPSVPQMKRRLTMHLMIFQQQTPMHPAMAENEKGAAIVG